MDLLQVILVLALAAFGRCATVGEFSLTSNDFVHSEENFTSEEPAETLADFEEQANETVPTTDAIEVSSERHSPRPMPEAVPIFKVIRDFLFQARNGLLEPLERTTEAPIDQKTEQLIKVIEHGLIEATTALITQMENTVVPTVPTPFKTDESNKFSKRGGEEEVKVEKNIGGQPLSNKGKRPTAFDIVANMSTSCSNCYEKLNSCVQRCFANHNCNDIQRNVRICPPTPNRLCNPFTPWNPVDECQNNGECKSPLICCNDGCINKCVPGVWRS